MLTVLLTSVCLLYAVSFLLAIAYCIIFRKSEPIWHPEKLKMPSFDFSHDPIYPTRESMKRPDGTW